jgi:plasmid maintenance system antidote protein VapI
MEVESNIVDDQGTDQGAARKMLRSFTDNGFDGDEERAGVVLGRPASEIRDMINGDLNIDDDMTMKLRGIADERGIQLQRSSQG